MLLARLTDFRLWICVLALLLAPVTTLHGQTATTPRAGGELVVGLEFKFKPLDPATMGSVVDATVGRSVFDTLLDIDEKQQFVPMLATDVQSRDARVYVVTLRDGVTFHDGTPFNAPAVKAHFDRLRDPKSGAVHLASLSNIASIEVRGDSVVVFNLKEPQAGFRYVLTDIPAMIASPTAMARLGEGFGQMPVGTGPFRVESMSVGEQVILRRAENYWAKGLPRLDRLRFRVISDGQARLASAQTGDIHVMQAADARAITTASGDAGLRVEELGGLGTMFVMYQTQRAPFNDVRARRAVSHASDMSTMNQTIYRRLFKHVTSPFPPSLGIVGPDEVATYPRYDSERAKALVKELGGLSFTFSVLAVPAWLEAGQALQAMWQEAGMKVTIEQLEVATIDQRAFNGDFQAMLYRWRGSFNPDENVFQFFHSSFAKGSSRNYTKTAVPELDRLLEAARSTMDDSQRRAVYRDIAGKLGEHAPYNFIHGLSNYRIVRKEVQGSPRVADGVFRVRGAWLER